MTTIKLCIIKVIDWVDMRLGCPYYPFCCWVALHPWWGIDWDSYEIAAWQ